MTGKFSRRCSCIAANFPPALFHGVELASLGLKEIKSPGTAR